MSQEEKINTAGADRLLEAVSVFVRSLTKISIDREIAAIALLLMENGIMFLNHTNHQLAKNVPLSDNESGS